MRQYKSQYYAQNREKIIKKQLARDKLRTKEIAEYQKQYRKTHKKKYKRNKNRLRDYISNAVYQALKYNSGSKNNISCFKYLDYNVDTLKLHLESLFEPWMSWNNRGIYNPETWDDNDSNTWTWQVDHIIPQSDLPYDSMEHPNFKKCWDLTNLRPLSAKQNCIDGAFKNKSRRPL